MARLSTDPERPATELAELYGDAIFTYLTSQNLEETCMCGGEWSNALSSAYTPNQVGMLFRSIRKKGHSRIKVFSEYKNHKRYWKATIKREDAENDRG